MESMMIWMPIAMAIIGLAYMLVKKYWVMKQDAGDGKMKEISDHIYEGALAFLNAEYRLLAIFVVAASVVLAGIAFYMNTTLFNCSCLCYRGYIFCICREYGNENCHQNKCKNNPSCKNKLTKCTKSFFWWRNGHGTWSCWFSGLRFNPFFIIFFHCLWAVNGLILLI